MAELDAFGKAVKGFTLRPLVNSDGTATIHFDGNTVYRPQLRLSKTEAESLGLKPAAKSPPPPPPPPPPGTSNAAGVVKTRLDAKSAFDGVPVEWFKRLSRLLAYPTAGDRYVHEVATLAYHDAWTTWGSSGASHIPEYVALAERDKAAGYAGQFMDDINFAGGNIAGTRKQYADLIEAVRTAIGPAGIIEINCQYSDIWPLIQAMDPDVSRALSCVDVVTKEFNVDPRSGINTAAKYASFLTYVDYLHRHGVHNHHDRRQLV